MVTIKILREVALSFPETTEESHFEKTSFRVKNKIFVTYDEVNKRACTRLSLRDQDIYSCADKSIIFPVDNKWGKQGWTFIEMTKVRKEIFIAAVSSAYCEVAPKKLAAMVKDAESE